MGRVLIFFLGLLLSGVGAFAGLTGHPRWFMRMQMWFARVQWSKRLPDAELEASLRVWMSILGTLIFIVSLVGFLKAISDFRGR